MEKWILRPPEWTGKILFNYETIHFCLIVAFLLTGIAICFMGYKYLQTLGTVFLGIWLGMAVIRAVEMMTGSEILKMSIFVTALYAGIAMIHFVLRQIRRGMEKCGIWITLLKIQYVIAALAGAGIVAFFIYSCVYRSRGAAVLSGIILAAAGIIHGNREAQKRPAFHSYDELCARKPSERKDENA